LDFDATSRGLQALPAYSFDASGSAEGGDDSSVQNDSYDTVDSPPVFDASDPLDAGVDAAAVDDAAVDDAAGANDSSLGLDGPMPCDSGIVCSGLCIDPASDPFNCGGCGNWCQSGNCGTRIDGDFRGALGSRWQLAGNAQYGLASQSALLTFADAGDTAGTLVYANPISTAAFDATFDLRMTCAFRGDGMGFMLEQAGPGVVGTPGGGLGILGLGGYAVEFDINNDRGCGDTNSNHVAVDSLASCETGDAGSLLPIPLFVNDLTGTSLNLADRAWHSVQVHFDGALSVSVDALAVAQNVALPGLATGPLYFGFGASSPGRRGPDGGTGCTIEVRAIHIATRTPVCL
jgi:hypothetical protein